MKVNINAKSINQVVNAETANIDQRTEQSKPDEKEKQPSELISNISGNIFISYRRKDSADLVGRIYDRLVEYFGREMIFKDVNSIPLGIDFKEYLNKAVGNCSALLTVIGDRWLEKDASTGKTRLENPEDFVRMEIEAALERTIPVIPLLVRGAMVPSADDLPTSLKKLHYQNGIQIRSDPDFHHDMDRLIKALANILKR